MKTAKEMFEELGFEYKKECYEHPLMYDKMRIKKNIFDLECDSFAFYPKEKCVTIWKDNRNVVLSYKELQAINKQVEELGWSEKI